MKKFLLIMLTLVLCVQFCGCSVEKYDCENNAIVLSTTNAEGVFSPFFSTAETDVEITTLTQVSMFAIDKNGKIAYGKNQPAVTLDYASEFQDKQGKKIEFGKNEGYTLYQFVIKKGVKFSDGEPLTIKDVIFNLYVYLDPVYTGGATIYSTKIVGLEEYRQLNLSTNLVKGVTVVKGDKFIGENKYDKTYDVLQIKINGIDPKAIWNFGFAVAPMSYYGNANNSEKFTNEKDYRAFKYPNIGDVAENYNGADVFVGFPKGNYAYFTEVIQSVNKIPMGAGVYKCSKAGGYKGVGKNENGTPDKILEKGFYKLGRIYYERNEFFVTTGGNIFEVYNAKIKYLQYKEVDLTNTLQALNHGGVHYGKLNCTEENAKTVNVYNENLGYATTKASGYGYIGISAKYAPNINIRRAIMSCFDVSLYTSYYPGALCEILKTPLSTCSWVYDDIDGKKWRPTSKYNFKFNENDKINGVYAVTEEYEKHMEKAKEEGYYKSNGKWYAPNNKPLAFTFTIAGGTEDHPSYQTFASAAKTLNSQGWTINLKTDSRALSKLTSGELMVWSAAWSAGFDPDMYQAYHINSQASSVGAWGYETIKNNVLSEDYKILTELSELIDKARATFDQTLRTEIYRTALDKLMDLAIEFPTYNRRDLFVWNKKIIDEHTLNKACKSYFSPLETPWKIEFVK